MRLALLVGLFVSLAVVTAAAAASAPRRRTSLSWTRSRQNMPLTVAAFADADFQLLFGMDGDTFLALFDMVRSGFSMRNWLCSRQSPPNVGWQWLFVCSPGRPTWTVCWRLGWAGAPYLKYFNACMLQPSRVCALARGGEGGRGEGTGGGGWVERGLRGVMGVCDGCLR